MKFHIHTYGCQMNERDSESVAALLMQRGHSKAAGEEDADLILVNTCSVRGKAEGKALGKLGLLVAGKREHPGRRVGVMGCMAQRLGEIVFKKVKGLDLAIGTHRLATLPAMLDLLEERGGPVLDIAGEDADPESLSRHVPSESGVSAFVNILFGCDRRCAYCIVPSVRGKEWSRPADRILDEVRNLAEAGVREVTLLGQSVMSYGRANEVWSDGHESPRGFREPFARLLESVSMQEGIRRIRFTSGHPSGCTDELAQAVGALPAVCEHLHLPLQSGSDRILGLMRRGYTADGYRQAVARLRAAKPGMTFSTDIIVGFPTETPEDFEMTRALMEEIRFDNAFIFKYSSRPGTPAAEWEDDVPATEKMRRNQVLLVDQDRHAGEANLRLVGQVVEVLAGGVSLRNGERWAGRSRANMTVVFEPAGQTPGDLVNVRIERVTPQTLYGKLT